MKNRPVKRKSEDVDTDAFKAKKRKSQNVNNIPRSSPKATQGVTISTEHLTEKKIKPKKKKTLPFSKVSPKQNKGTDNGKKVAFTPDRTESGPASNGSKQMKKKINKQKKLLRQSIINRVPVSPKCSDSTQAGTVGGLKKRKRNNKQDKGVQNLPRQNVVSSNVSVETSVSNIEARKKKKKKKKKNKLNQGALNVSSATDDSGSSSPSKSLQKKTKTKKLDIQNEKKDFSASERPISGNQIKKENQDQGPAKPDSSKFSNNENKSNFGQQKGNDNEQGTSDMHIECMKGKAKLLKKHITKLTKCIGKLNVNSESEEKQKIRSQVQSIRQKIEKLESDLTAYQKCRVKGTEIINQKVYRGLPEDPPPPKKTDKWVELKEFLQTQMSASRFRWLNENLYTSSSEEAQGFFKDDPESFKAYHQGYSEQVAKWPLNPLDVIIKELKSLSKDTVVADLGCGEAKLAAALPHLKVHSVDLIALKPEVIACDMAHCPLLRNSVDVVVFCLSLMGTNVSDFLLEANRILKIGGTMEIAEVESRFDSIDDFVEKVKKYGFTLTRKDPTDMFFFLTFKKKQEVTKSPKLPEFQLKACVYKKR